MLRILHFRSIEKRALNFYPWEKVFWILVLNFIRSLFNWIGFLNIRPEIWLFQGNMLLWWRCWLFDHWQLLLSERFMFRFFILFFWTFFDNFFGKIIKFYFTFSRRVGLLNLIRCFYRTLILKYSSRKLWWGLVDLSLNIGFLNVVDWQFRSTHHFLKRGMLWFRHRLNIFSLNIFPL